MGIYLCSFNIEKEKALNALKTMTPFKEIKGKLYKYFSTRIQDTSLPILRICKTSVEG